MNKDMTYCVNRDCPYTNCDRHMKQLEGKAGVYSFASFDSVCRRYMSWLMSEHIKSARREV